MRGIIYRKVPEGEARIVEQPPVLLTSPFTRNAYQSASIFFLYLECLCMVVAELAVPFFKLILHIFNVREGIVKEELLFFPELPMICRSALFAEILFGLFVVQAVYVVS